MKFRVHVGKLPSGQYQATCLDPQCTARGGSPQEAAEAIRREIRFHLELCPCTAVGDDFVELELTGGDR